MSILLKLKPGTGHKMGVGDSPTFDEWMERIDRLLRKYRSISLYDLPDVPFRDWYDERLLPVRAANRLLREASEN